MAAISAVAESYPGFVEAIIDEPQISKTGLYNVFLWDPIDRMRIVVHVDSLIPCCGHSPSNARGPDGL